MTAHAIILLTAALVFLLTKNISFLTIGAAISFAALFVWNFLQQQDQGRSITFANLVTLLRLFSLFGILIGLSHASDWWIGIIALAILLLDGLDGYLARRFKTASNFGAYLDMETDAFFVLSLSSLLYLQGKVGAWILALGWLRYVYFLVLLFFKPKIKKESKDYFAQVIAVALMASLIAGFLLPKAIYLPSLVIAGGLVFFSFGKSFSIMTKHS